MAKIKLEVYNQLYVEELIKFGTNQINTDKDRKALRIYNRCMLNGHPFIASRIAEAYPNAVKVRSDVVMAFGMVLMAQKSKKV